MRASWRFLRDLLCGLLLVGCRVRVFGREHVPQRGGALLVGNHQSFLDPILLAFSLPREVHFMARDTLFHSPFFGRLIGYLNTFPVRRGRADIGALRESLRRLKSGGLLTVFPEATRTPDGSIQTMRSGVVLLARKARVPLVPAMILGAFEAWPRHQRVPRPKHIRVAFGPPVTPDEFSDLSDEECIGRVRDRIIEMGEHHRRLLGRR